MDFKISKKKKEERERQRERSQDAFLCYQKGENDQKDEQDENKMTSEVRAK